MKKMKIQGVDSLPTLEEQQQTQAAEVWLGPAILRVKPQIITARANIQGSGGPIQPLAEVVTVREWHEYADMSSIAEDVVLSLMDIQDNEEDNKDKKNKEEIDEEIVHRVLSAISSDMLLKVFMSACGLAKASGSVSKGFPIPNVPNNFGLQNGAASQSFYQMIMNVPEVGEMIKLARANAVRRNQVRAGGPVGGEGSEEEEEVSF